MTAKFLHPVLFTGTPDETGEKHVTFPKPIAFKPGPEYEVPYALLTEDEGRQLVSRWPDLFAFPPNVDRGGSVAIERIEALEAKVHELDEKLERFAAILMGDPASNNAPKKAKAATKQETATDEAK